MNKLNEVRQFKKIAGLIKESHPANDKWYDGFEDGLRNLVRNEYISKEQFKYFMDALDHIDPMDNYGHMASAHSAAKEFVDDLRTKIQMDADEYQYRRETGLEESRDDFDMAEVKKFQKIAGIKEDDYSEDPSSDMDDESESGDTATMGNIDEDEMDARRNQDMKTQYGQGGVLNI